MKNLTTVKIRIIILSITLLNLLSVQAKTTDPPFRKTNLTLSNEFTLFQNIQTYLDPTGEFTIEGEIFCPTAATYTFEFAFTGVGSYIGYLSDGILRPQIGEKARKTVTANLHAGTNQLSLKVLFSKPNQSAYARLVIDKINGQNLGSEQGYVDLVAQGTSQLQDPLSGKAYHWVCKKCNMINSEVSSKCIGCGTARYN
ncbi:Ran-binding zinc finger domain-containing protein [Sphingobacterium ginsenosidimutans]|uniref:RanBP2-type domain-containing protein n=1 Tax=Sphingobacterium ginsenosidimutans TaxID=687845 RepID=A0ABP8AFV8_9SPHI